MIKANTSLSLILIDAKAASVSSPFVINEVPITVFDDLTTESDDLAEGKIDSKDQTPEKSLQVIRISCFKVKAMLLHITEQWQAGEQEAQADIAAGRVTRFDDVEEALNFLENPD